MEPPRIPPVISDIDFIRLMQEMVAAGEPISPAALERIIRLSGALSGSISDLLTSAKEKLTLQLEMRLHPKQEAYVARRKAARDFHGLVANDTPEGEG